MFPLQTCLFPCSTGDPSFSLHLGWCNCRTADNSRDAADVRPGSKAEEKLCGGSQLSLTNL